MQACQQFSLRRYSLDQRKVGRETLSEAINFSTKAVKRVLVEPICGDVRHHVIFSFLPGLQTALGLTLL